VTALKKKKTSHHVLLKSPKTGAYRFILKRRNIVVHEATGKKSSQPQCKGGVTTALWVGDRFGS